MSEAVEGSLWCKTSLCDFVTFRGSFLKNSREHNWAVVLWREQRVSRPELECGQLLGGCSVPGRIFTCATPAIPLTAADTLSRETAESTTGGNVEQRPWVWTSGDFSKECGASNLIDGNTNTMWIGNVDGEPWRVILDLGIVTDVTDIQVMFQDTEWANKEIIVSRDGEVWFDSLAETNEWVPLRYLYINLWGDEQSAQPPAIREIIWRDR